MPKQDVFMGRTIDVAGEAALAYLLVIARSALHGWKKILELTCLLHATCLLA